MCLAIPGKIKSIYIQDEGMKMAKVNFAGVVKDICIEWLDDPAIGDFVLVHAGFALNKLDEKDARETLDILRETGDIPSDYRDS